MFHTGPTHNPVRGDDHSQRVCAAGASYTLLDALPELLLSELTSPALAHKLRARRPPHTLRTISRKWAKTQFQLDPSHRRT